MNATLPRIISESIYHMMKVHESGDLMEQIQDHVASRLTVDVKNLDLELSPYYKGHTYDAGFDIFCCGYVNDNGEYVLMIPGENVLIKPHETIILLSNIAVATPVGIEVDVRPRSSASKQGLLVHYGTVDPGYRGRVKVTVTNLNNGRSIPINYGDRISQLVPSYIAPVKLRVVDQLPPSLDGRGTDGHGSTGRN